MPPVFLIRKTVYRASMTTTTRKKPKPRTRRVRSARNASLHLTERDLLTLEVLQGGPLSSLYLHEFTKDLAKDSCDHRKRLRMLFDLGYIDRPKGLNNELVWGDFAVYSLDEKGKEALGDRINEFAPLPAASVHNFWNATIMANLRLNIPSFLSAEDILKGKSCPDETKRDRRPLAIGHTEPDDLFGIEYAEGYRFFAVETDMASENYENADTTRKSTLRMIEQYAEILETGAAKERFGIPNFFVLIFTPRESRTQHIMDQTQQVYGGPCRNILFKTVPEMQSRPFRTAPLLPEIAATPFLRAGCDPFDILNPERQ